MNIHVIDRRDNCYCLNGKPLLYRYGAEESECPEFGRASSDKQLFKALYDEFQTSDDLKPFDVFVLDGKPAFVCFGVDVVPLAHIDDMIATAREKAREFAAALNLPERNPGTSHAYAAEWKARFERVEPILVAAKMIHETGDAAALLDAANELIDRHSDEAASLLLARCEILVERQQQWKRLFDATKARLPEPQAAPAAAAPRA